VRVDLNASEVTVVLKAIGANVAKFGLVVGQSRSFRVEAGDFGYLASGKVFRAKVEPVTVADSGENVFRFTQVWPAGPSIRSRFENVNRMLRRDTIDRGERGETMRSVGDYLPPFAIIDQDGKLVAGDFFDDKRTVVNFIFTRCSVAEMCPTATNRMRRLQNLVFANNFPGVQFLSITLDPEHDFPGVLKTYAAAYQLDETNFRLCTATKPVIVDLLSQFGVSRIKGEKATLDHTMLTLLVNGRRQIVHQVPGKSWSTDDFLARLGGASEGSP